MLLLRLRIPYVDAPAAARLEYRTSVRGAAAANPARWKHARLPDGPLVQPIAAGNAPITEETVMADRDPYIARRLADSRIASLFATAGRTRVGTATGSGWRRTAGRILAQFGEALAGERGEPAAPLRPAGFVR